MSVGNALFFFCSICCERQRAALSRYTHQEALSKLGTPYDVKNQEEVKAEMGADEQSQGEIAQRAKSEQTLH